MQKHNQQLTKQNKLIGLVKSKFNSNKLKIYQAYYSMNKIKDFKTNNDLKPLIELVGKWRYFIGIKEELSKEELFMNINFIRENFNELNLVDIDQAINLSIKGEFDIDIEHYQSFTPLYISKILNAYKKYKGEVMFSIRSELSKIENKPKKLKIEDRIALTKASLQVLYNSKDNEHFSDGGNVTYDFIKRNNLLPITKNLVQEAMDYGKKLVSSNTKKSAIIDALNNTSNNVRDAREKKEYNIRQNARNYVVLKWLNSFNESEFKNFLNSINKQMI